MPQRDWREQWEAWRGALSARGAVIQDLMIGPVAREEQLVATETRLGRALPSSLRNVLLEVSAQVRFKWYLGSGPSEPRPLRNLSRGGELEWNWDTLDRYRTEDDDLQDDTAMYGEDGAILLTQTVVFQEVGNGDCLAVDFRTGAVVYLNHEGGPDHGAMLAPTFADFVNAYSAIGCSGPDWEVLEAVRSEGGLDPTAPVAQQWRAWVGLPPVDRAV
jgi:hypothetical protein